MFELAKIAGYINTSLANMHPDSLKNPVNATNIKERIAKLAEALKKTNDADPALKDKVLNDLQTTLIEKMQSNKDNKPLQESLEILSAARSGVKNTSVEITQETPPTTPPVKLKEFNNTLNEDGINPSGLNRLKEIYKLSGPDMVRLYNRFSDPANTPYFSSRGTQLEEDIKKYLTTHTDPSDPMRTALKGYFGTDPDEIGHIFDAACWSFALSACRGSENAHKNEDWFVRPSAFFNLFSPHILEDVNATTLERVFSSPILSISKHECDVIFTHRETVESLIEKARAAHLSQEQKQIDIISQEVVKVYLQILGYEIAEEGTSPYVIGMYADQNGISDQDHWGLEVSTDEQPHLFETLIYRPIGHKNTSWDKDSKAAHKKVISVWVKKLRPQQIDLVKKIIEFGQPSTNSR